MLSISAFFHHRPLLSDHSSDISLFLKNVLGFRPHNIHLYQVALTHKSAAHIDAHGWSLNNERLEYLGDAILSAVVADYLYKRYPHHDEGFLTVLRSKVVSRVSLNALANRIGLVNLIDYNRSQHGIFKSMGGNAVEALVGAIYLDRGYRIAYDVITRRILGLFIDVDAMADEEWNYKSKLIDWGQRQHRKVSFQLLRSIHGSSRPQFECQASVDGQPVCSAIDFSIKGAEQRAAEKCFKQLLDSGAASPQSLDGSAPV